MVVKIAPPLRSRFFVIELEPYTYDAVQLLTHRYGVKEEMAEAIANTTWRKSQDIRDCLRIEAMAKSVEDVNFIADSYL